jgi:protein-L-isoaspartate(D-aspartate) O-methyltransferase
MVEGQIAARGVRDRRVLKAMEDVPRHAFVPAEVLDLAYSDQPLPIGDGQTISQPYVVAYMTEVLEIGPRDRVLEVGTGSGYQTAVLAEIARAVLSIEIVPRLARRAGRILRDLGIDNVHLMAGDGRLGWPRAAPFDAVLLTAAPRQVPAPLFEQLHPGGRLVAPVGQGFRQSIRRWRKGANGRLQDRELIPVRFVPLAGRPPEENG